MSNTFYKLPFDNSFNKFDYTLDNMSGKSTFCLNTCMAGTNFSNTKPTVSKKYTDLHHSERFKDIHKLYESNDVVSAGGKLKGSNFSYINTESEFENNAKHYSKIKQSKTINNLTTKFAKHEINLNKLKSSLNLIPKQIKSSINQIPKQTDSKQTKLSLNLIPKQTNSKDLSIAIKPAKANLPIVSTNSNLPTQIPSTKKLFALN
jgi:hypothetical protein